MIINDFEVNVIREDEVTNELRGDKCTLDFDDIYWYLKAELKGAEVTMIKLMAGDSLIVDLKYEAFKKKYNERKAELINAMGNRP